MRVVAHQPGVVARRERRQRRHRRAVPVHREDRLSDDERVGVACAMAREKRRGVIDVVVGKAQGRRAGQPGAGMQAGMRQLVDEDQIVGADEARR